MGTPDLEDSLALECQYRIKYDGVICTKEIHAERVAEIGKRFQCRSVMCRTQYEADPYVRISLYVRVRDERTCI